MDDVASRVVLAVSPGDDRTTSELDSQSYRAYLRRTRAGTVTVGEEWTEFVNCGCGTTRDVTLRVVSVHGAEAVGDGTEFVFAPAAE